MKLNFSRGLIRLWIFVSAIWLVISWVFAGDLISNRYPYGDTFTIKLEFQSTDNPELPELISSPFVFEEYGVLKQMEDSLKKLDSAKPDDLPSTIVNFPNGIKLYISALLRTHQGTEITNPWDLDPTVIRSIGPITLKRIGIEKAFESYIKKLRKNSLFGSILDFSKIALLPPLGLLLLGNFLIWAIRGFQPKI